MDKLIYTRRLITEYIAATRGTISVLWQEIGADYPSFEYAPDRRMVSASLIKTQIMAALLNEVSLGNRGLGDVFHVSADDITDDSVPFDRGARDATLEELLNWMIVVSDNTSTNVLIDAAGMGRINAWCTAAGLKDTVLERKMLDFPAIAQGRNNYTSARDQFNFFNKLINRDILTPDLCGLALDILKKQRSGDMLTRYIWEDVALAHKTGGLDYLCHDAGVFFPRGALNSSCAVDVSRFCAVDVSRPRAADVSRPRAAVYFLAVLLQDSDRIDGDRRLAGNISRAIYDYYCTNDVN